jgi:hypothetical protein
MSDPPSGSVGHDRAVRQLVPDVPSSWAVRSPALDGPVAESALAVASIPPISVSVYCGNKFDS